MLLQKRKKRTRESRRYKTCGNPCKKQLSEARGPEGLFLIFPGGDFVSDFRSLSNFVWPGGQAIILKFRGLFFKVNNLFGIKNPYIVYLTRLFFEFDQPKICLSPWRQ